MQIIPAKLSWNLDNLEIKTWGVEMALRPIVKNITSLVKTNRKPSRKKGCSKKSAALVKAVEIATVNFVEKGEMIARENHDAAGDIMAVVGDIRAHGQALMLASRDFSCDPCSSVRRGQMVRAAQELLTSVTRLLILADMLDVHLLLLKVNTARQDLQYMAGVTNQKQLMEGMRRLERSVSQLSHHAGLRQRELKDPVMKDGLAAARAVLIRGSPMLLSSCNVSVRYPDLCQAAANRETIHRSVDNECNGISPCSYTMLTQANVHRCG